jgi:DNA-binding SARP family transcriptional activator
VSLIEFRTLGTIDLRTGDGRELYSLLAQPKRIAFLAYLCVAQPRGFHRRDTLLALFWPNADQDHARASLRKALHALRRALGDDSILSRGDEEVAVDFQYVFCDAAAFDVSLSANRLEEALEIYRGDLLAGFFIDDSQEFEQWLQSERTRLRAAAARAAYAFSDQLEAGGNVDAALAWARRSLELADTDERGLRKLIELQCKAGGRVEAIQAYEAFVRHLAAEYQTEPSSGMRSLIERVRSGTDQFGSDGKARAIAGRERNGETTGVLPEVISMARALETIPEDQFGAASEVNTRQKTNRLFPVIALALAVVMAGVGLWGWGWMRPAPSRPVFRYNLAFDSAETMVAGAAWWGRLAISPDGLRLAYIGGPGGPRARLLIRPRNLLHATALLGSEGAITPFFSPDGQHIGFLTEQQQVQIASIDGGPPIVVTDTLVGVMGASWGRDGFIYADGRRSAGLVRVEAKPGVVPKWFTTLDTTRGEIDHTWPDVLPNGKGVLFTIMFNGKNAVKAGTTFAIGVAEIPSGKHRVLVNDAMYARYAASGHLLYVTTNKTLMLAPFDQNSMKVTGEPTALIEGIRLGGLGAADLAVSESGTLVYVTGPGEGNQELVWVSRDGKAQSVDPDWQAKFWAPALSPDGKQLALEIVTLDGTAVAIWTKQLDRGPNVKLTMSGPQNEYPAWTPDGRSLTFMSNAAGNSLDLWTKRADGSGQARLQYHEQRSVGGPRWSADGKWLVFATDAGASGSGDILGIRPGIDTVAVPLVATKYVETTPSLSPDGRWLAYTSNESGQFEIYVASFPNTGAAKWAVSSHGGIEPAWSHSGRELFYRDASSKDLVATEVRTSPSFSLGRSTTLFPAGGFRSTLFQPQYAVSPDDRRFLMIRPAATAPDKLIVVENWFEELKAKSPK